MAISHASSPLVYRCAVYARRQRMTRFSSYPDGSLRIVGQNFLIATLSFAGLIPLIIPTPTDPGVAAALMPVSAPIDAETLDDVEVELPTPLVDPLLLDPVDPVEPPAPTPAVAPTPEEPTPAVAPAPTPLAPPTPTPAVAPTPDEPTPAVAPAPTPLDPPTLAPTAAPTPLELPPTPTPAPTPLGPPTLAPTPTPFDPTPTPTPTPPTPTPTPTPTPPPLEPEPLPPEGACPPAAMELPARAAERMIGLRNCPQRHRFITGIMVSHSVRDRLKDSGTVIGYGVLGLRFPNLALPALRPFCRVFNA
jgi:hypothetical protein